MRVAHFNASRFPGSPCVVDHTPGFQRSKVLFLECTVVVLGLRPKDHDSRMGFCPATAERVSAGQ